MLARNIRMARYLKPAQIYWRARYMLERRLPWIFGRASGCGPEQPAEHAVAGLRCLADVVARFDPPGPVGVQALREGTLTLLNVPYPCTPPVDWHGAGLSRLAQFHLHEFRHARALALRHVVEPQEEDRALFLGWLEDWLRQNERVRGVAWHPYVISSRIVNWSLACSVFDAFGEWDNAVLDSLARQALYLSRHIEYDVRANHLIKNAAALAVAGALLKSQRLYMQGLELLETEIGEQILEDGGHYEGSLMYHEHVLRDCLLVQAVSKGKPRFLTETIDDMAAFLAGMLHTDDQIPLFGDATFDGASSPKALLQATAELRGQTMVEPEPGPRAFPHSGFHIMQNERARMIIKSGFAAPDYQPGHSHCDWFSYEFCLGSQRFIVDSGVQGYERGPWRAFCRSTRAHSTLQLDAREQFEFWGAFRAGRRTRPQTLEWAEDGSLLRMAHEAWRPSRHTREIRLVDGAYWVVVDRVDNPRKARATSRIHFHPRIRLAARGGLWRAHGEHESLTIIPIGEPEAKSVCGQQEPLQGWHCPEFGVIMPAPCLSLSKTGDGNAPLLFGYALVPIGVPEPEPGCLRAMLEPGGA